MLNKGPVYPIVFIPTLTITLEIALIPEAHTNLPMVNTIGVMEGLNTITHTQLLSATIVGETITSRAATNSIRTRQSTS